MSFVDLAKKRCSVRKFVEKEVTKEILLEVMEAARIAPSAKNMQPWHFIIATDKHLIKKISTCYTREWLQNAPAIIVAIGKHSNAWVRDDGKRHTDIDLSIAIDHITLQAVDMGLGTCWICWFDVEKCKQLFDLQENEEPIALIPIGYPAQECNKNRHKTARKQLSEIISFNKYK